MPLEKDVVRLLQTMVAEKKFKMDVGIKGGRMERLVIEAGETILDVVDRFVLECLDIIADAKTRLRAICGKLDARKQKTSKFGPFN